jgi:hypothetical protein
VTGTDDRRQHTHPSPRHAKRWRAPTLSASIWRGARAVPRHRQCPVSMRPRWPHRRHSHGTDAAVGRPDCSTTTSFTNARRAAPRWQWQRGQRRTASAPRSSLRCSPGLHIWSLLPMAHAMAPGMKQHSAILTTTGGNSRGASRDEQDLLAPVLQPRPGMPSAVVTLAATPMSAPTLRPIVPRGP